MPNCLLPAALFPRRSEIRAKKLERSGAGVLSIVQRVGLEDDDVVGLVLDLADCHARVVNEAKCPGAAYDIEDVLLRSVVGCHGSTRFDAAPCDLNFGADELKGRCVSEALIRLAQCR
jgi:hypothetical protein